MKTKSGPFHFINQTYLRIFFAQGLSQICDRMMMITAIWLISTSFEPAWSSWFIAFGALPHLILFKWTPGLIRKMGPLKIVLYADLIRGFALILGSLLFIGGWNPNKIVPLFLVYFFVNIFAALFNPAIFMLPTFLSNDALENKRLVALIESCFSLSNVIAPLISVFLFSKFGLPGLILINGVSYLAAWGFEKGLKPQTTSEETSVVEDNRSTVSSLFNRDPLIVYLLGGFFLLNLLLGPLLVLIPLYATKVYFGDLSTLNGLEFALAVGTLIGSLSLTFFSIGKSTYTKIVGLLIIDTALFALFCFTTQFFQGVCLLGLMGCTLAVVNVIIIDFFQTRALPAELALVMSYVNLIGVATLPLSLTAFGLVLDLAPDSLQSVARNLSVLSLILVLVFAIVPYFSKKFKKLIYD